MRTYSVQAVKETIDQWKKHGLDQDDPNEFRKLQILLLRLKMKSEVV